MSHRPVILALAAAAAVLVPAGCGSSSSGSGGSSTEKTTTQVEVIKQSAGGQTFDPGAIYKRESPGVVTVISVFPGSGIDSIIGGGGAQEGLGSGFVISKNGEIATNAHVITNGKGTTLERAKEVYVKFGDGNQVPAKIVGADPNEDVGLIKVDPNGLNLQPLPLGTSEGIVVGAPVAAIGSPFGEDQSLSVGVVSATNRDIDSLTSFKIFGAIQTDAAINHGNSGGPLVDAGGRVIGINSQIQSTGGGGEGVGFAVPVDGVKRSLDQLRTTGKAEYAYLGVSTVPVFPQLAEHFHLSVKQGAWVQSVSPGGPALQGGMHAGQRKQRFQVAEYLLGGDIITKFDGVPLRRESDLSREVAAHRPGDTVTLTIARGSDTRELKVKLARRPDKPPAG